MVVTGAVTKSPIRHEFDFVTIRDFVTALSLARSLLPLREINVKRVNISIYMG